MKYLLQSFSLLATIFIISCGGGGGSGGSDFNPISFKVETVVKNASFPVSLVQAPDGRLFYTELTTGNIRVISDGKLIPTPVTTVGTLGKGNEGLLGIALDPDFSSNGYLYAYYTAQNPTRNLVTRMTIIGNTASNFTTTIDNLPYGGHDGGRLTFGSDGTLFVSVGDAGNPDLSQSQNSYAGKILRVNTNGTIPSNNPDPSSPIFAAGLRNAFGLAVDPRSGILYASDNGPSCDDELNRVEAGDNLGWRVDQPCSDTDSHYTQPLIRFNPSIAPTGITFYEGNIFPALHSNLLMADFINGNIMRFQINEHSGAILNSEVLVAGQLGPLIDVVTGRDGYIYVLSTNSISRLVPNV